ncbi:MAG: YebC/PmpR family DNA-binding transcriptional regulator, partial [Patescibacteria group bacterium]
MSGHNKWSQIKHRKALTDAKKGKIFSKMARLIAIASRAGGGEAETNPTLRSLIDKARSLNMPIDNIERAIAKGTGKSEGAQIEEFLLEAYGPAGSALLIEGATDNRNRSISELKFLLGEHNGKLANPGSVLYLFERLGLIVAKISPAKAELSSAGKAELSSGKKEELELLAIDAGAQDIKQAGEETLEIYTKPGELEKIKKTLKEKNIKVGDASIIWFAKNETPIADAKDKERLEKLFEALDEHD